MKAFQQRLHSSITPFYVTGFVLLHHLKTMFSRGIQEESGMKWVKVKVSIIQKKNRFTLKINWLVSIVSLKMLVSCVCVCVCVCACVCVYTLPPVGFFRLHDVCDIREKFGSTIFCCEYQLSAFCQVPSSLFPNLSYFTSKDVTPACRKAGQKTNDIMLTFRKDYIYGYRT